MKQSHLRLKTVKDFETLTNQKSIELLTTSQPKIDKNKLLKPKKIKNDNQRPSLFPPKSIVSNIKNAPPAIIIIFLSNLTLMAPMKTPSSQNAIVAKIKIRYT